MSNNTNTLFWVITGAVIVLGVFLLIQTNQDDSLNRINNKFNEVASSKINNSGGTNYYIDRNSCGRSEASVGGFDVFVTGFYDNGYDAAYYNWHIVNNNTEYDSNKDLVVTIYTCETNEYVSSVNWAIENIPPMQTIHIKSYCPTIRGNWDYYVTAEIVNRG